MQQYNKLPRFPEPAYGLASLKSGGHMLAAFSNGEAEVVRRMLDNTNLLPLFDDIASADQVIKPDPAIYAHAAGRLAQANQDPVISVEQPF
jgi:FMN phosphatase YigB (HAD superfamily)